MARFKIEYLRESTEENSVCYVKTPYVTDLEGAAREAWIGAPSARAMFNANGFQIRDMDDLGRIVALETFEEGAEPEH